MLAVVSFLISSLVVASLSSDVSKMTNQNFFASSTTRQNVISVHKKSHLHHPEDTASDRGSGRRYVITTLMNSHFSV